MPDGDPIIIGKADNLAGNPTSLKLGGFSTVSLGGSPSIEGRYESSGDGVVGYSDTRYGVLGDTREGVGVFGTTPYTLPAVVGSNYTGIGAGVSGRSSDTWGVIGNSTTNNGVRGVSYSSSGVYGESTTSSGVSGDSYENVGVRGSSYENVGVRGVGDQSIGVWGTSSDGYGVLGNSPRSYGVFGSSDTWIGVYGRATGQNPATVGSNLGGGYGVSGLSPSGVGVYGSGRTAGYFNGPVTVTGHLSKQGGGFRIDHPRDPANKYLNHSFVESSEMKNVYDGVAQLDEDGTAAVDLPEWFETLNRDFRYQLTAVGGAAPNLHVAEEISESRFKIAGGEGGMKVCWQVTGTRKDRWAAANPFEVEEEKPEQNRGRYLDPSLYDAPEEQRVMIEPIAEAGEEDQRPPEPLDIAVSRLEEEHLQLIDELDESGRLEEEQKEENRQLNRRMIDELSRLESQRREMEERQEEAPPEST